MNEKKEDTLDEELLQNDLAEELTIENSNTATLGVIGNKPRRKERRENRSRETRKQIWKKLCHKATEDEFVEKMRLKRVTFDKILERYIIN